MVVKWVASQAGDRDSIVDGWDAIGDTVPSINEELVFGLVEKDT